MGVALATLFGIFGVFITLVAAGVYFYGIPSEWKEKVEEKLIEHAGESEATNVLRGQLRKLPETDRSQVEGLSSGISKLTGGDVKNPMGKFGGAFKKEE